MRFYVKNKDLFPLPNNKHMLHLGTIAMGLREFVVMVCLKGSKKHQCYIEEVVLNTVDFNKDVWANLKFIDDDNLAADLAAFAEENKLTDMKERFNELGDRNKLSWIT